MKIIVDTNIVFSSILNTNGQVGDLLMNSADFEFYTCEYLKVEIDNHKDRLMSISKLTNLQFRKAKDQIFSRITIISESQIPYDYWHEAAKLVVDVDMDDIAFVALSKYMQIPIWTGDKKLIKGLSKKGFNNLLLASDLLKIRDVGKK